MLEKGMPREKIHITRFRWKSPAWRDIANIRSIWMYSQNGLLSFEIEVDYPLGDYREPMDDDTLYSKFDSMVLPETGKEKRDKIVEAILNLEKLDDISDFTNLLAN